MEAGVLAALATLSSEAGGEAARRFEPEELARRCAEETETASEARDLIATAMAC